MNTRILDLLKLNGFIWWFLFLFSLEFNLKEQSFRVYRGQLDISRNAQAHYLLTKTILRNII